MEDDTTLINVPSLEMYKYVIACRTFGFEVWLNEHTYLKTSRPTGDKVFIRTVLERNEIKVGFQQVYVTKGEK